MPKRLIEKSSSSWLKYLKLYRVEDLMTTFNYSAVLLQEKSRKKIQNSSVRINLHHLVSFCEYLRHAMMYTIHLAIFYIHIFVQKGCYILPSWTHLILYIPFIIFLNIFIHLILYRTQFNAHSPGCPIQRRREAVRKLLVMGRPCPCLLCRILQAVTSQKRRWSFIHKYNF